MNRRELLKLMAVSAPTIATLGCSSMMIKPAEPMSAVTTLNVIFEGPMIFLMQNPQVQVLVPQISGHQYVIDGSPANAGTFSLRGLKGIGDVTKTQYDLPKGADAFRLSASQLHLSLDLSKTPYQTFSLPAPDRVTALSIREADIVDAFGNRRTAAMPMSYAFTYQINGTDNVALDPNPGWQAKNRVVNGHFANLVIATGLGRNMSDPMGEHVHTAFGELISFFPGLGMKFFQAGEESFTNSLDGVPEGFRHANGPMSSTPKRVPKSPDGGHLVLASAILDCEIGGVIINKP